MSVGGGQVAAADGITNFQIATLRGRGVGVFSSAFQTHPAGQAASAVEATARGPTVPAGGRIAGPPQAQSVPMAGDQPDAEAAGTARDAAAAAAAAASLPLHSAVTVCPC